MNFKLLSAEFTNEILLSILPFETGYLLRKDDEDNKDAPCEHSVQLAMAFKALDYSMNPHKMAPPWTN
jgi:hypothetical protein